jgi:hypothetical protein
MKNQRALPDDTGEQRGLQLNKASFATGSCRLMFFLCSALDGLMLKFFRPTFAERTDGILQLDEQYFEDEGVHIEGAGAGSRDTSWRVPFPTLPSAF